VVYYMQSFFCSAVLTPQHYEEYAAGHSSTVFPKVARCVTSNKHRRNSTISGHYAWDFHCAQELIQDDKVVFRCCSRNIKVSGSRLEDD